MSDDVSLIKRVVRPFATNDVETDDSGWYPELEPRRYEDSVDTVLEAVRDAVGERERWSVVEADPDGGRIEVEVQTEMMEFIDDLTIRVESDGDETVVHARSRSRVGKGDFGQNARTIRELFERLDGRLGASSTHGSGRSSPDGRASS